MQKSQHAVNIFYQCKSKITCEFINQRPTLIYKLIFIFVEILPDMPGYSCLVNHLS